ncbi:MBL fold metallo-hydrolase [Flavobacterium columnare]|uniref:MBL fold metallo-hydrolase n=1 Tax=Flavobacterium columnare TaxID=996 RepID=UPI0040333AA3
MKLTIHGYSTALFATWYAIEELGIIFDAGDGLVSGLMGKCGKFKHLFITHPDRDHLTGLLAFNQMYGYNKPTIYYPKDCKSFPFLETFTANFDPQSKGTQWIGIEAKELIALKEKLVVEAIKNEHIYTPNGENKSLSYKVWETKKKLKQEFLNCSANELKELRIQKGEAALFEEQKSLLLSYSGDTPVTDYQRYNGSKVLIHEATFLTKEEQATKNDKNQHSSLEEVMQMIAEIEVGEVILGHFSSRYANEQIIEAIKKWIAHYNIKVPIYLMPIGKMKKDILDGNQIN